MSLMDPKWKYITAARTNVAATFARVRRELKQAEVEAEVVKQEPKVRPIKTARKAGA